MNAPRFSMTTAGVDGAVAVRDAGRLTEAALWCWGRADAEAAAEFEQVLQVFSGIEIDVADPRQIHRATFAVLDVAAVAAQDDADHAGDIADLAVDAPAVVFDVLAQWCRHIIGSIEHT